MPSSPLTIRPNATAGDVCGSTAKQKARCGSNHAPRPSQAGNLRDSPPNIFPCLSSAHKMPRRRPRPHIGRANHRPHLFPSQPPGTSSFHGAGLDLIGMMMQLDGAIPETRGSILLSRNWTGPSLHARWNNDAPAASRCRTCQGRWFSAASSRRCAARRP